MSIFNWENQFIMTLPYALPNEVLRKLQLVHLRIIMCDGRHHGLFGFDWTLRSFLSCGPKFESQPNVLLFMIYVMNTTRCLSCEFVIESINCRKNLK